MKVNHAMLNRFSCILLAGVFSFFANIAPGGPFTGIERTKKVLAPQSRIMAKKPKPKVPRQLKISCKKKDSGFIRCELGQQEFLDSAFIDVKWGVAAAGKGCQIKDQGFPDNHVLALSFFLTAACRGWAVSAKLKHPESAQMAALNYRPSPVSKQTKNKPLNTPSATPRVKPGFIRSDELFRERKKGLDQHFDLTVSSCGDKNFASAKDKSSCESSIIESYDKKADRNGIDLLHPQIEVDLLASMEKNKSYCLVLSKGQGPMLDAVLRLDQQLMRLNSLAKTWQPGCRVYTPSKTSPSKIRSWSLIQLAFPAGPEDPGAAFNFPFANKKKHVKVPKLKRKNGDGKSKTSPANEKEPKPNLIELLFLHPQNGRIHRRLVFAFPS